MTDDLPARTPSQALEPALNTGLGALVPRSMTEAMETAKMLHASGWFRDLRDAGQALTKIVLGAEMGVSPITAVRGIFIIETQRGPVLQLAGELVAKLMKAAGYDWTIDCLDSTGCELTIRANGRVLGQIAFTQEHARKAGLVGKRGPWSEYPEDMYFNRAICRAQRRFAPEVTGGMPMPVLDAEEVAETYPDPRDDLMLALFATYRERFPKPREMSAEEYRDARLWWSEEILGREVQTWNGPEAPETLTRADAQTLLAALEDPQPVPPSPRSDAGGAQAGPQPKFGESLPAWARPADSSAGVGGDSSMSDAASGSKRSPAGPLSAGATPMSPAVGHGHRDTSAEHTGDQALGEVAPPEGPEPREAPDAEREAAIEGPPGPGPAQVAAPGLGQPAATGSASHVGDPVARRAAPRRRSPAPNVAQLREAQQDAEATRKPTPANPLQWLSPEDRMALIAFCYGRDETEQQETAERLMRNMALRHGWRDPMTDEQLVLLRQQTFGTRR